jgi:hypothetical protein
MRMTLCPACGFDLGFEPWRGESPSDEICSSCGIQFGYDDFAGGDLQRRRAFYGEWRADWIAQGMPWFSSSPPPDAWDPARQLREAGLA